MPSERSEREEELGLTKLLRPFIVYILYSYYTCGTLHESLSLHFFVLISLFCSFSLHLFFYSI